MNGKKAFVIDVARCCGCYNCQFACKDEHVGNDWRPYAAPQPNIGQFWMRIHAHERGALPHVKLHYIPVMCAHCENAACVQACKAGAILQRGDGLITIAPDMCSGCGECIGACPIGAIYFNREAGLAQKCTGCAHLIDSGREAPRCVGVCPTGALKFVDEDEVPEGAVSLIPEDVGPRVWYLNIPGRFIAGAVYDPAKSEVIHGAVCVLASADGGSVRAVTDGFGDFWFENAPEAALTLSISAAGYARACIEVQGGRESVSLGDIPLVKSPDFGLSRP